MPTVTAQPSFDKPDNAITSTLSSPKLQKSNTSNQEQQSSVSNQQNSDEHNFAGKTTGILTIVQPQPIFPSNPQVSFQILNPDYLLGQYQKPNAIVRPLRRNDIPSAASPAKPAGPATINRYDTDSNKLFRNDSPEKSTRKTDSPQFDTFAKELENKLKRLRHENKSLSSKNSSYQDSLDKRPLFITTVPTGIFLPPPSPRGIYAFSSRPRVVTVFHAAGNFKKGIEFDKKSYDQYFGKNQLERKDKDNSKIPAPINGLRSYHYNFGVRHKRDQSPEPYKNVMYDRRVIRGTNFNQGQPWNPYFAYAGLLSGKETDCTTVKDATKEAESRRRQMLRRRTICRTQRNIIGTPPPIAGRRHENIQTEKYLEELFERPPEFDQNTQTDLFLQRPPSPPYIPAKIGIDAATEICDGELFNFDAEVQPILETLVGHTVEQGLIEVLHEEEIAELRKQQEEFLTLREKDLAEVRRLEAEEIRLQTEKERRLRQDAMTKELDAEMQNRVTAAKLLQGHIASLLPEVLEQLEPITEGTRREDLERTICPWLTQQVAEEVGQIIDSREILTEIIKEIIKQRAVAYANYSGDQSLREEIIAEEDETLDDHVCEKKN